MYLHLERIQIRTTLPSCHQLPYSNLSRFTLTRVPSPYRFRSQCTLSTSLKSTKTFGSLSYTSTTPRTQLVPLASTLPRTSSIHTPIHSTTTTAFNTMSSSAPVLDPIEASKRLAAWTAVDRHVLPEHRIIGIGSGSTVPYVVERIVQQGAELNKSRIFIPTGFQSKQLIVQAGLALGDVDQFPIIDVTIDGADECDKELNCVKGGGACQLREKVLAEAAKTFIVVADYRKNVELLGTSFKQGVPIEVVPFAYAKVLSTLQTTLGSPSATLRMAKMKAGPVVTDNSNFVIDAPFGEEAMKDPYTVLTKIKMLTGVVEVGLFCRMAKAAYFGNVDGSVTVKKVEGDESSPKIVAETLSASV